MNPDDNSKIACFDKTITYTMSPALYLWLRVLSILGFAALVVAIGFLAGLAADKAFPAPQPAPVIAPSKCDGQCSRPAPPLKCFDVICPYCRKRFTVDPNPNSTGATKDSYGKALAKPVSGPNGLVVPKPREPWYRRRFTEGPRPKFALNSGS